MYLKLKMKQNTKKLSVIRLMEYRDNAVKRNEIHRFSFWCAEKFGISPRGIYEKLRWNRTKKWEWEGVENCVREYMPEWDGDLAGFWQGCSRSRNLFAAFMADKQMSYATVWKRFGKCDFSEMELKGIKSVYREYRSLQENN